jgi:16S rRNA (uracil1498-N3)-methyltransferase
MADRYFVEAPILGPQARLVASEAHHLAHVMRAKPGATVTLFDGSGAEFPARVATVGRSEIELEVLSREAVDRELPVKITLGVALPKGDRQRWLVEKATELGVARLVPLETERAVDRISSSALERLRRAVIEASKQCGRNRLMQIEAAMKLAQYVEECPGASLRLIAHPVAGEEAMVPRFTVATPREVDLAIGPEGGFTNAEVEHAQSLGWQRVSLGSRILRVETAAVALVAAIAVREGS